MAASLDDWKAQHIPKWDVAVVGTSPIPEWDVAVVGTSPIPVVDAIYHCLSGRKVVLLEKRATIGGAWGGTSVCGIEDVDIGSHDICINRLNAEFLEKYFGIEFIDVQGDECRFLPKGGCAQMTKRLIAIAQKAGVCLKTRCNLENVWIEDAGCLLEYTDLTNSQSLKMMAKKVVKPSCVAFEVLQYGKCVPRSKELFRKNHLYFIVEDSSCSENYFLKDIVLGGCNRISNLTQFVPLKNPNQRMFVVELEEDAPFLNLISEDSIKELCGKIVVQLQKRAYLSAGAKMISWDAKEFTYQYSKVVLKKEDADKFEQINTFLIHHMQRCRFAFTALNAESAPSPTPVVEEESASPADSAVA